MSKLNQEESEILKAYEAGELKSAKDAADIRKRHQRYAEAMLKKALAGGIPSPLLRED